MEWFMTIQRDGGGGAAFSFCFSAATISEMGNGGEKGAFVSWNMLQNIWKLKELTALYTAFK